MPSVRAEPFAPAAPGRLKLPWSGLSAVTRSVPTWKTMVRLPAPVSRTPFQSPINWGGLAASAAAGARARIRLATMAFMDWLPTACGEPSPSRSDREADAAAAAGLGVGVADLELGPGQFVDEVDLRAPQ